MKGSDGVKQEEEQEKRNSLWSSPFLQSELDDCEQHQISSKMENKHFCVALVSNCGSLV